MNAGTKLELVGALVGEGMTAAKATQYADAFLEYREATTQIEAHGIIVLHPRTGAPMENPYLPIRDRALKKLEGMKDVRADVLWKDA
jgi:phage terminase small subunit